MDGVREDLDSRPVVGHAIEKGARVNGDATGLQGAGKFEAGSVALPHRVAGLVGGGVVAGETVRDLALGPTLGSVEQRRVDSYYEGRRSGGELLGEALQLDDGCLDAVAGEIFRSLALNPGDAALLVGGPSEVKADEGGHRSLTVALRAADRRVPTRPASRNCRCASRPRVATKPRSSGPDADRIVGSIERARLNRRMVSAGLSIRRRRSGRRATPRASATGLPAAPPPAAGCRSSCGTPPGGRPAGRGPPRSTRAAPPDRGA